MNLFCSSRQENVSIDGARMLAIAAITAIGLIAPTRAGETVQPDPGDTNRPSELTKSATKAHHGLNRIGIDLERIGIVNGDRKTPARSANRVMDVATAKKKLKLAAISRDRKIRNQFCDQPPTDQLCPQIPKDNTDFTNLFVYSFILASAQDSFDIFSWQSFVAMNWPQTKAGDPVVVIGSAPTAPRKWFSYRTPQQIFNPNYVDATCDDKRDDDSVQLVLSTFRQTGGLPLIDRNLNFVLYDIRVNDVLADYIVQNGLASLEGQLAFAQSGREVDFPVGYYDDPQTRDGGREGSAAIKSAWRILSDTDDETRYFSVPGLVSVAAKDSNSGDAMCLEARLSLVGMHIMQRTETGNGREWTWSTFEHVDNAPLAVNSRKPIDTLHRELFKGGCKGPKRIDRAYAFYDPECTDCATNSITSADFKWSASKPYAAAYAQDGEFGTQVVRCWRIFEGTADINAIWQQKLQDTVWANYQASSAQWKGANRGVMFPQGEVPRFLINTTMETYDQYSDRSSCLSCHADARTLAGKDSNFSFLLSLAGRYQEPVAPVGLVRDKR